ncbi:cytochrome P450 [Streptomyces sp. CC228A]|uniref:cytochrome P450 n=1 Tax=Streptomyces sp. CC228A TaxID=2898186 RepID=UPI0027E533CB|nr:cytochrome P450 [Streptomyces sp. CC228A]
MSTTVAALPRAVARCADAGLWDAAADDRLRPALVTELLRVTAPSPVLPRVAAADATVAGCPVRAGDRLVLVARHAVGAHRDEPDPYRPAPPGIAQLVFGAGPHACPGARLARAQLDDVLAALAPTGRGSRRRAWTAGPRSRAGGRSPSARTPRRGGPMTTIAVTGASGFCGSHVARTAAARGARVLCVGRRPGPVGEHVPWDAATGLPDLADADLVVHCAAAVGDPVPGSAAEAVMRAVNVDGTARLLRPPPAVPSCGSAAPACTPRCRCARRSPRTTRCAAR